MATLVPPARAVPALVPRHRVEEPRAQQRPRLVVRMQLTTRSSTTSSSATTKARQIGDGLVRDALHALAREVDAPPSSTVVVNPTARARPGSSRDCYRAKDRVTTSAPDGTALPTQLVGVITGEVYKTMVTGQKVRWVLDLDARHASSRVVRSRRTTSSKGPSSTTSSCRRRGRSTTRCDLSELKAHMLALGEDGTTMRLRVMVDAAAPDPLRHGPGRRLRLGVLRRRRRRVARGRGRRDRRRARATSICASRSTRATAPTGSRRPTASG